MLRSLCAVMCGRGVMSVGMMGLFGCRLMISLGIVLCGTGVVLGCFGVVLCCGAVVLCGWMFCHSYWDPLLSSIRDGANCYAVVLGGRRQEMKIVRYDFVTGGC